MVLQVFSRRLSAALRGHLRVCWPGVIVGFTLVPANVHDTAVGEDLLEGAWGWAVGGRNYLEPMRKGVPFLPKLFTRARCLSHLTDQSQRGEVSRRCPLLWLDG